MISYDIMLHLNLGNWNCFKSYTLIKYFRILFLHNLYKWEFIPTCNMPNLVLDKDVKTWEIKKEQYKTSLPPGLCYQLTIAWKFHKNISDISFLSFIINSLYLIYFIVKKCMSTKKDYVLYGCTSSSSKSES